ncbi:TPA: hypothetical protein ROA70_004611 [Escherichia coli]|nr:hypothetical protein [Escherichia coli]
MESPTNEKMVKNTTTANEFKNGMDDEKSQKGNGSTERANKTSKTQSERFLAL